MGGDGTTAATRTSTPLLILIALALVLLSCTDIKACAGARLGGGEQTGADFIRDSCRAAEYPALCLRTLAPHAAAVGTSPLRLARAALAATLDGARSASSAVSAMAAVSGGNGGMSRGEAAAVRDCADMLGDAVDELRESAAEMGRMKEGGGNGERFAIANVQTWVSAALTNDDTCVDGLGGDLPSSSSSGSSGSSSSSSSIRQVVRNHVVNVAQLTSNALFFINKLTPPVP